MKKILLFLALTCSIQATFAMAGRLKQLTTVARQIITLPRTSYNNSKNTIKNLWERKKELVPKTTREKSFLGAGYLKGLKAGIWYTYMWFKRDEIKTFIITHHPKNTHFYDIPDLNFDTALVKENTESYFTKNELLQVLIDFLEQQKN